MGRRGGFEFGPVLDDRSDGVVRLPAMTAVSGWVPGPAGAPDGASPAATRPLCSGVHDAIAGGTNSPGPPEAPLLFHKTGMPLERFPFALAHGPRSNTLFDRVIHRLGGSACADRALAAVEQENCPIQRSWSGTGHSPADSMPDPGPACRGLGAT
jgi:hypothetical protein